MTNTFLIFLTQGFLDDLERLHAYIMLDSPLDADHFVGRILDSLDDLQQFPFRSIAKIKHKNLRHPTRFIVVKPYLVYYRVLPSQKIVRVLSVRHGARKQPPRL